MPAPLAASAALSRLRGCLMVALVALLSLACVASAASVRDRPLDLAEVLTPQALLALADQQAAFVDTMDLSSAAPEEDTNQQEMEMDLEQEDEFTDSHRHSLAELEADMHVQTLAEVEAEAAANAEAEAHDRMQADTEADSVADVDAELQVEVDMEAEVMTQAQVAAMTEAEAEAYAQAYAEAEVVLDMLCEAEVQHAADLGLEMTAEQRGFFKDMLKKAGRAVVPVLRSGVNSLQATLQNKIPQLTAGLNAKFQASSFGQTALGGLIGKGLSWGTDKLNAALPGWLNKGNAALQNVITNASNKWLGTGGVNIPPLGYVPPVPPQPIPFPFPVIPGHGWGMPVDPPFNGTLAAGQSFSNNRTIVIPPPPPTEIQLRLRAAREEILVQEALLLNQTETMKQHMKRPVLTTGEAQSSGSNYWEAGISRLRSSASIIDGEGDHASLLTQSDTRCVICQFVVQQAIGLLVGKPLTSGGAMAGGKRALVAAAGGATDAAPAAAPAAAAEVAAFLEFDASVDRLGSSTEADDEDMFSFLELDASVDVMAGLGVEAVLAAEMESTVALNAAMENFLSAADTAMQHTAVEAERSHYGRRAGPVQRGRHIAQETFPVQLNDFGFDNPTRNRQADILQYRPRAARFQRGDAATSQAKWDETRAAYQKLYSGVYAAFETLCSKRMPVAYSGYCTEMMRDYRYIAQGIQYGDKPQSICMNGNWCDRQSYMRHAVHAFFVREAGDN